MWLCLVRNFRRVQVQNESQRRFMFMFSISILFEFERSLQSERVRASPLMGGKWIPNLSFATFNNFDFSQQLVENMLYLTFWLF